MHDSFPTRVLVLEGTLIKAPGKFHYSTAVVEKTSEPPGELTWSAHRDPIHAVLAIEIPIYPARLHSHHCDARSTVV